MCRWGSNNTGYCLLRFLLLLNVWFLESGAFWDGLHQRTATRNTHQWMYAKLQATENIFYRTSWISWLVSVTNFLWDPFGRVLIKLQLKRLMTVKAVKKQKNLNVEALFSIIHIVLTRKRYELYLPKDLSYKCLLWRWRLIHIAQWFPDQSSNSSFIT